MEEHRLYTAREFGEWTLSAERMILLVQILMCIYDTSRTFRHFIQYTAHGLLETQDSNLT